MTTPATYTYDNTLPKITGGNAWTVEIGGSAVYVGGNFNGLGGVGRINLGAFDLLTKAVLPFAPINGFAPIVDILYLNGVIYIASLGPISSVSGPIRNYVAAFDTAGNLLPWDPNANAPVRSLATDGVSIFLGGDFTTLGGGAYTRNHVARVDAATGVPDAFSADTNGTVYALKWDTLTSSLFVTGSFAQANATARNNAASFDNTGALLAWNPNLNGQGNSIDLLGALAYVGGYFSAVNAGPTRYGLAAFDKTTGVVDPQNFGITSSSGVSKVAISPANQLLYVGGFFGTVQGTQPNGLVSFDPVTGLLNPPGTSFNAQALDIAFSATYIIVAGFFSTFLGAASNYLPMFGSYAYGTQNYTNPGELDFFGMANMDYDPASQIIYGGYQFTSAIGNNGTFSRYCVAAYDLNRNVLPWNPILLGSGGAAPQVTGLIHDSSTGLIYICGRMTKVNGITRKGFAAIDASGALVGPDLGLERLPFDPLISGMYIDATHIYIVGRFTSVNYGTPVSDIARFDKFTGVYDATWTPTVAPSSLTTEAIHAIASDGTYIYIGGTFTTVTGVPKANLARLHKLGGGSPSLTWTFDANSDVFALALDSSNNLYVGGNFNSINATPAGNGLSRILATPALDPTFGLTADLQVPGIFKISCFGSDVFVSANTQFAQGLYTGNVFGLTQAGNPNWFQPKALGGTESGFLSAAGRLFFSGNWQYLNTESAAGGFAAFYTPALPPTTVPQAPKIRFLNRRPQQGAPALTMLRWDPVVRDFENNQTVVTSYRIYRSISKNLEDPTFIAEITSRDLRDVVDTLFVEEINGYYRYCVSAVNAAGEGGKSCINFAETEQLERLG
jgi:hypothetical protein